MACPAGPSPATSNGVPASDNVAVWSVVGQLPLVRAEGLPMASGLDGERVGDGTGNGLWRRGGREAPRAWLTVSGSAVTDGPPVA
jgi:hypothetical protein